jgi:hypothetical protein
MKGVETKYSQVVPPFLEAFNDMFVAYTSEKVASLINVIKQSLKY